MTLKLEDLNWLKILFKVCRQFVTVAAELMHLPIGEVLVDAAGDQRWCKPKWHDDSVL